MASFWSEIKPSDVAQVIGGVAKATPALVSLFQQPKETGFDPASYAKDLQAQTALKTQALIAAQQAQAQQAQAQAAIEVERLRSSTTSRMLIYGGIAILVAVGIIVLAGKMKSKEA